jgi:hypothetical protein
LDVRILQNAGQRVRRRRWTQRLDAAVERFLLRTVRPRPRGGVVQLIQPRDHDVLAIFERQRVLILAVLRHRALAGLDEHLLPCELLRQPLETAFHVLPAQFQVLLHVALGQRVHGESGQGRVGGHEADVNEPARPHGIDRDA